MSIFNQIQWAIIENPYNLKENKERRKEEKDDAEEWKELCKKKKEELPKEEYVKWRKKEWYKMNKSRRLEKQLERYHRNKVEEEILLEDIYKNVYDPLPEPINYNKLYAEKYDKDDRDGNWKFRFYWWASRLNHMMVSELPKYESAIKVYNRWAINLMLSQLWKMQDGAYEYIKPHIDEFTIKDLKLSRKQFFTKSPMWVTNERMQKLLAATSISNNQICTVASALLRDKYIQTELYMGRVSFLVWDIIITQGGNVFRPILENNIPWLTKDTVEELHQKRLDWLSWKTDDLQVYALWDCYLLKIQLNERETLFYFTPT